MERSFSFISNAHPQYIDQLYQDYLQDPQSVEPSWQAFFSGYDFARKSGAADAPASAEATQKEIAVLRLINDYRTRGHLFTKTNPVRTRRSYSPTLDIENYQLTEADLDTVFQAGREIGLGPAPLREIIEHLQETYCKSIGAEFRFIRSPRKVHWLQERMESTRNRPVFALEEKKRILHKLNQAVVFENFLHTKFVGQKRFSLEGGETLIPGLDAVIERGAELGIEEFIIGMPHRGRLNVLANILNKDIEEIFSEFEGEGHATAVFEGDVKYHLGFSSVVTAANGKTVKLGLAPNPSHLESVDPVVEGMVRAKIDHQYDGDEKKIAPILIHGDAAVAGQGVVYEVIQMSLLNGYRTGGTIHLVVNNQLGFTTNYLEGRSSTYCTDVAKVTLSPVFHVNADDVEAVVLAIKMAVEYRQEFHTDVFIDLLGYRKYGHNESDEPRFTQPTLYKIIEKHPNPREIYHRKLVERDQVDANLAREMEREYKEMLQKIYEHSKVHEFDRATATFVDACDLKGREGFHGLDPIPDTGLPVERLREIGERIFTLPAQMAVFDKVQKIYQDRLRRIQEGKNLDWAIGEMLAYGTLLCEGVPIRLSGQDVRRGTFSHRHSTVRDDNTEQMYVPLNHLQENQALFRIYDSLLSEYAVLGFDYGYSCASPQGLTIWEAQFGDFANGAQIIIDQYIASSEIKWNRSNGIALYLPHSYEGQGPEHSSARIERYLSLCAKDNMQLVNITTPANLYHLLRAHVKYPFRMPLVVFTPKSLLRHPRCVSSLEEFAEGGFERVMDDPVGEPDKVQKIVLCSGKFYYELAERKLKDQRHDVAVVRLEQIYPLPEKELLQVIKRYPQAKKYVWVQEEPENSGCWPFLKANLNFLHLDVISREASPTPATGYHRHFVAEQNYLLERAFRVKKQSAVV